MEISKGKSFTAEEIIKSFNRKEKLHTSAPKQSELITNSKGDSMQVLLDRDLKNQPMALDGHKISNDQLKGPFKASWFLADMYDEYLRMYQLASDAAALGRVIRSEVSKRPVTDLNFEDWIAECRKASELKKEEVKRQFKAGKLTKQNLEISEWVCAKNIEACNQFLNATKQQQIGMV